MAERNTTMEMIFGADWQELVLETTIGKRDHDGGRTFSKRLGDFPPNAILKFLRYGFQRVFNDRVGGSLTTLDQKLVDAEAMIAAYQAGNVGRQPSASADPLTAECRLQARVALRKQDAKKWKAFKDLDKDAANDYLDAVVERNPSLLEKAEKVIKQRQAEEKKPVVIDLAGMDL